MDVSVIIVNTNEKAMILNCLRSVHEKTRNLEFEIFVVDNASRDGSVEAIKDQYPQVHVIENKINVGFSAACNQPTDLCKGRNILYLNPDTLALNNALKDMSDFLDHNPKVGSVGCKLLNVDGSLQPSCRNFLTSRNLLLQHLLPWRKIFPKLAGKLILEFWSHDQIREVDWIIGACLMVKKHVIDEVGLKDEDFFMFHEETDWCYRSNILGWKTVFLPTSSIIHFGGHTTKVIWGRKLVLRYYEGKHLFIKKHYGNRKLLIHRFLMSNLILMRLARYLVRSTVYQLPKEEKRETFEFFREALLMQIGFKRISKSQNIGK
jgi:GT2 family glycosyltransferase